jgi:hypothetical protein
MNKALEARHLTLKTGWRHAWISQAVTQESYATVGDLRGSAAGSSIVATLADRWGRRCSGTIHLLVAIGIGQSMCYILRSRFRRYDRRNEMHITSHGPPLN